RGGLMAWRNIHNPRQIRVLFALCRHPPPLLPPGRTIMKLVVSMVCTGLAAFLAVQAVQAQQLQTPDVQTTISGNDTATIHPWAIAVDEGGNIYSTDWLIGSVRINTPYGGGYTSALASIGDHMLDFPKAVAI